MKKPTIPKRKRFLFFNEESNIGYYLEAALNISELKLHAIT